MVIALDIRLVIASLVGRRTKLCVTARNFSDLKYTYAGISIRSLITWTGRLRDKRGVMGFNLLGQCVVSCKSNGIVVQQYDRCEEDCQDRQRNMR